MKNFYKGTRRAAAVAIGIVFFVAGFLKVMDPVGSGLVMEDYFKFLHIAFLVPAAKALGFALALAESFLGILLVTGLWRRLVAILSAAFLGFFTVVTALLAIFNPPMDCGCFGQAIHLSNLQTFVKNIVLDALWCYAFLPFRDFDSPRKIKYATSGIAAISISLFAVHSILGIPMMDFSAFNAGAEVQQEDALLTLCDSEGRYLDTLDFRGRIILSSVYDPLKMDREDFEKLNRVLNAAKAAGYATMQLYSAAPEQLPGKDCYAVDRRTLMTLNRSNGGLVYVSDRQIIRKWSFNNLPDASELEELYGKNPTEEMLSRTVKDRMRMQGFLLYVFAVMLLL